MINKVFCFDFPEEIELPEAERFNFDLSYYSLPVEEYHLCLSQALMIFSNDTDPAQFAFNYHCPMVLLDHAIFSDFKNNPGEYLRKEIGEERIVNPRQFELLEGSVVRSKVDPRIGPGIVKEVEGDEAKVLFPGADLLYENVLMTCHISTLRVVTHIEEVKENERQKDS